MSLTTYSGLLAEGASWLRRTDLTLEMPTFVTLAEAEMNRRLDCRQMYATTSTFSISSDTVAVPTGFAGEASFHLNTSPVTKLKYVKPDALDSIKDQARYATGKPQYYTVIGDSFVFSAAPDTTYQATLRYRQRLTPLTDLAPSNWLLASHPDAYLYGMLAHSAPYLKSDERLPMWLQRFGQILEDINTDDERRTVGSSPARFVRSFG